MYACNVTFDLYDYASQMLYNLDSALNDMTPTDREKIIYKIEKMLDKYKR